MYCFGLLLVCSGIRCMPCRVVCHDYNVCTWAFIVKLAALIYYEDLLLLLLLSKYSVLNKGSSFLRFGEKTIFLCTKFCWFSHDLSVAFLFSSAG